MTQSEQNDGVYFALHLSGGATTTLAQLIKLVAIETATNMRARDLFPAGVIADSAGAFEAVGLHDLSAMDVLKGFIKTSQTALPPRSFFVHQFVGRGENLGANIISPQPYGRVRYSQSPLRTNFSEIIGEKKLGDFQWGLSIALHNPHVPRSDKITFIRAVPVFGKTGSQESLIYSPQPIIELSEVVLAATAIPGVYEAVQIEGLEGQYIDATIDQDPTIFLHEIRVNNPDIKLGYVRLGNISPDNTYLSREFGTATAIRMRDKIRPYLLREHTHSSLLGRLVRRWGEENVYDLETLVDIGKKGSPDLNPISNTRDARERIVKAVMSDLLAREEEYKSLMRTLVREARLIQGTPSDEDIVFRGFEEIIPEISAVIKETEDSLTPPKKPNPPPAIQIYGSTNPANKSYELGYAAGQLCRTFLYSISPKLAHALKTGIDIVYASMNPLEDPRRKKSEP